MARALNIAMYNFFRTSVNYLGLVIVPDQLNFLRKNTAAVLKDRLSTTQTELLGFLGMCSVYRRFAPKSITVTELLNQLLTKGMQPSSHHRKKRGSAPLTYSKNR